MTGRPGPLRAAVTLLGLLLVAQVLLGGAGPAAAAASRTLPRSAAAANKVRVDIGSVAPPMLTPTATLQVKGTITNTGAVPLTGVYVRLVYRYEALADRAELQKWAVGDAALTKDANEPLKRNTSYRQTLPAPLLPHRNEPVTLTVPASVFGLTQTATAFGPRGIAVEVWTAPLGSRPERVGVADTFMVWDPVASQQPTRITVLVPVTSAVAQGDASEPTSALVGAMQSTGRLGRLITTVQDSGVSWAIDPALLAAASRAQLPGPTASPSPSSSTAANPSGSPSSGSGPAGTAGSSPAAGSAETATTTKAGSSSTAPATGAGASSAGATPGTGTGTKSATTTGNPTGTSGQSGTSTSGTPAATAASWLNAVRTTASTNPPQVLPFGDPDLTALAHNGGRDLLTIAREQGDAAAEQILGSTPRSSIAWPYDGRADDQTAGMLTGSSWQGIVLGASTQPPASAPPFTPSGRSSVRRAGTPLQGLLYDEGLSALLGKLGAAGITSAQATQLRQRLLAELATITAERPEAPRHLLITAPRNWDPEPSLVKPVFDALNQVPWVQVQSTDALLAERPATGLSTSLHYPKRLWSGELSLLDVQWALARERQLAAFTPALTSPQLVVPDLQHRIVSMVGVVWRGHPGQEMVGARSPLQSQLTTLRGAVSVLPGSVANLLSHSGRLPVTVRNQLDQPVRVQLVLRPHSGLLLIGRIKPFTIGAHSSHTSLIPVRAVGNGEVQVVASLWTTPKSGSEPLSQAPPLLVRVHSNWETIGLSVSGGLLGLLLVVGLFRSIRRGRKPLPPESAPDPDEVLARQESGRRLPAVLRRLLGRDAAEDDEPHRGPPRDTTADPDPRDARTPDRPIRRRP